MSLPKLWADGEHDDTAALLALMRGEPIENMGSAKVFGDGVNLVLHSGWFTYRQRLELRGTK